MKLLAAVGAAIGLAVAYLALRRDEGDYYGRSYYDPANPRHRDPEFVLLEDGFLVEEPGLIEPFGSTTLGVSAEQQTIGVRG